MKFIATQVLTEYRSEQCDALVDACFNGADYKEAAQPSWRNALRILKAANRD